MRWVAVLLATLVSAALFAAAFPPLRVQPLAFVCLAPFLMALRHVGWRGAIGLGLLWGWATPSDVADALPASIETYFLQSAWMSWALAWGVITATATLYWAAFALVYRLLATRPGPALPFLAAAAWAAMELARASLFTGSNFWGNPWVLIGFSQVGVHPLMQVASLGGIYAVAFLIVAPNAALAELWLARSRPPQRRRAWLGLGLACAPVLVASSWGAAVLFAAERREPAGEAVRVAVVQPNLDLGSRWREEFYGRNLEEQLEMTREAAARGASLVIWPESALTFHLEREPLFRERIARVLSEGGLQLLTGGPSSRGRPPLYYNSIFLLDAAGRLRARYDKRNLVPFAEYVPLRGLDLVRRSFDGVQSYTPGEPTPPLPSAAGPAGVLICNEAMLIEPARVRVREGAGWLVSPSNDSWIARDKWADMTFDIVAVRAIENRRWLVRASSSGPSGIVDPFGRVLSRTAPRTRALVVGEIRARSDTTLYTRTGDLFALLCAAAVAAALGRAAFLERRGAPGRRREPWLPG